jgi:hypothetical protein
VQGFKKKTMNRFLIIFFSAFMLMQLLRPTVEKLPDSFEEHEQALHTCYDSTHATCDGWCECDGVGCQSETVKQ